MGKERQCDEACRRPQLDCARHGGEFSEREAYNHSNDELPEHIGPSDACNFRVVFRF